MSARASVPWKRFVGIDDGFVAEADEDVDAIPENFRD